MKIKELVEILCFLRKCKSCIVIKDNLQLRMFGEYNETTLNFNNEIMKNSIEQKPVELSKATRLESR